MVITTVRVLVARIVDEVDLVEQNMRKDYMFINKCWNVIRVMADNSSIVPLYIGDILNEIKPLLVMMEHPEKIDFDEDIVLLAEAFVKNSNTVHPIVGDIIRCFPMLLKKQEGVFG